MTALYSVGIDLGTTNSVVAYTRLDAELAPGEQPELALLPIPQLVGPNQVESRFSLPSFLYLPREGEVGSLELPGVDDPSSGIAGIYARSQAADNPQRVVVAAKSWLCHSRVGRTEAALPWQSPPEVRKVSAVDCTRRFLMHLVAAWQASHPEAPLGEQRVVLTVPASFDPSARDLTREAALAAGLPNDFVLLEEPQAAVYRWLAAHGESWRRTLAEGDLLLVVDVGGGTTDLTLVVVDQVDGELALKRLAVGNHLLLGGDNMDLALAHFVAGRMREAGHDLDPWQNVSLWHACRDAKERLLASEAPESHTVAILGRGSSLIGGTISADITRDEVQALILDGFLPSCKSTDRPERSVASGFQDIGLPYEADPAITRQVAAFLAAHRPAADKQQGDTAAAARVLTQPTHILFNGGVFRSAAMRDRLTQTIANWCTEAPRLLGGPEDLDTAVAIGAAYYGWSKVKGGIRIRGGTARSYYVGIETAGLAIPGMPRPLRALCVAPRGMEEGTETPVPGDEIGVVVDQPARFRFFSSTQRPGDTVGTKLDRWSPDELIESEPIELNLSSDNAVESPYVPVRFLSRITELGMFELWCQATRSDQQWKLEFNIREPEA
jgi:molecular chaperone DnaK (HSP70)